MPAPFYNLVKGTTAGAPGTGAFTPNAAAAGFLAWSTVPSYIGLIRYGDGSDWELRYGYWNGTTITRPTAAFVASSTGSGVSLTSSATAALVVDGGEVQSHFGSSKMAVWMASASVSSASLLGIGAGSNLGTAAAVALTTTNFIAEQPRIQYTSATTANAQAGNFNGTLQAIYNTTAGRGGWELTVRFGASQLPTGPRLYVGMTSTGWNAITTEPSAHPVHNAIFGKDSTDTNIQFMTNNGGTAGKTDTGIAWVADGWYEATIWQHPGEAKINGLLIRLDDPSGSNIWYDASTTPLPVSPRLLTYNVIGSLSGTTGTALIFNIGQIVIRLGG